MYFINSFLYTPQHSHLRISAPGSTSRYRNLELMAGVEPATSSLPRMRSTTELHQQHGLLPSLVIRVYKKSERKTGLKPATPSLEG